MKSSKDKLYLFLVIVGSLTMMSSLIFWLLDKRETSTRFNSYVEEKGGYIVNVDSKEDSVLWIDKEGTLWESYYLEDWNSWVEVPLGEEIEGGK